jgi:hypothetical protein
VSAISRPIAQWCLPLRRQQAGRLGSTAINAAGAVSQKPIAANSAIAEARRTVSFYGGCAGLGNRHPVCHTVCYVAARAHPVI